MIKSMTAFARAETTSGALTVSVEIRSVNSRNLDVVLRTPHGYLALEEKIKTLIPGVVNRGRIELKLDVRDESETVSAFEIDSAKASSYYRALVQLKETLSLAGEVDVNHLLACNGLIRAVTAEHDPDQVWTVVQPCAVEALAGLDAMRVREGDFLARDFSMRLDDIEQCLDQIEAAATDLVSIYRDRLRERIAVLTQGLVDIDPGRIAQEAALLADRSEISEEIVRARSHLKQFRDLMAAAEPAGRKLNFLLQEFNREFNTMGAKAGNARISHTIVAVKSELEKLREQVQNVE
jgi:uncharacterized protein (TIGR00255 family)